MASPGQKRGGCGHLMAGFDSHSFCTRCRDKGKGPDPCISDKDCNSCNILTADQHLQLSTPSYEIKNFKEKRESKKASDTPTKKESYSSSLIDPSSVTVVGAVDDQGIVQSPSSSSSVNNKKKKVSSDNKPKSQTSKPPKSGSDKLSQSSVLKNFQICD